MFYRGKIKYYKELTEDSPNWFRDGEKRGYIKGDMVYGYYIDGYIVGQLMVEPKECGLMVEYVYPIEEGTLERVGIGEWRYNE